MLFRLRYLPKPQFPSKQSPVRPPVENPCGPSDEPCVLLLREFYNFAWGYTHYGWFMDTEGNEFVFQVPRTTPDDTIRKATADDKITPAESLQMKHDSTNLDLRVLAGEVTHTLSLVWTAKEGTLVRTHRPMCPDGAAAELMPTFSTLWLLRGEKYISKEARVPQYWRRTYRPLQSSSCGGCNQRSDELEAHW